MLRAGAEAAAAKPPGDPAQQLPVLQGGSFFTYSDKEDEYWSGYYTSRPFVKRLGRHAEALLHAVSSLAAWRARGTAPTQTPEQAAALASARWDISIFQHRTTPSLKYS